MDYPKFIVSNQEEESISIQRVNKSYLPEIIKLLLHLFNLFKVLTNIFPYHDIFLLGDPGR